MAFGQSWVVRRLTKWKAPTKLLIAGLGLGAGGLYYLGLNQNPYRLHSWTAFFDPGTPVIKTPNFYYSICGIKNKAEQKDSYALFPDVKISNSSPLRISLFSIFDGEEVTAPKLASQNFPTIFGTTLKQKRRYFSCFSYFYFLKFSCT